ncbi:hypothetical protein Tco_1212948 [Tanacetum coccineum]
MYDRRVNKRQMLKQEGKVDLGKALDAGLIVRESSETESEVQNTSSRSGNDTDTDDADIRPIYDKEPIDEVELTAECNIIATGQQRTEQPEIISKGRVDQDAEECQVKSVVAEKANISETSVVVDSRLIRRMTSEHNSSSLEP